MSTLRGSWLVLALLGVIAPGCKSKQPINGQCVFNSDCDDGLICAGRYCRTQCNLAAPVETRSRDCPAGTTCRTAAQGNVGACLPTGDNGYCVYHSECTSPLVCNIDGRCSAQCREHRDCQAISLDPGSTCNMVDGVGTCSFRDGGMSQAADTGTASTDTGSVTDTGATADTGTGADTGTATDAGSSTDAGTATDTGTIDSGL